MGQMRFVIPRPERLIPGAAEQAYLASGDGIPWECHDTLADEALVIERDTRESGYLYFPWKVAGRGLVQLCSGSLMERPKPYNLPMELARGTLNRLRNQASLWQTAGMVISDQLLRRLCKRPRRALPRPPPAKAIRGVAGSGRRGDSPGSRRGGRAGQEYAQQVLTIRRSQHTAPSVLLGARSAGPANRRCSRAVSRRLQHGRRRHALARPRAEARRLSVGRDRSARRLGPREQPAAVHGAAAVQMDKHALPDWLFLDDGFEEVQASVLKFIEAVVKRYRGKVQLWHVTARMNQDGAFAFSEEQRLRLVVDAVDRVRGVDRPHAAGRELQSALGRIHRPQGPGTDADQLCRHARPRRARFGRRRPGNPLRLLARRHAAPRRAWKSAGSSTAGHKSACR